MKRSELAGSVRPEAVAERLAEQAPGLRRQEHDHGHGGHGGQGAPMQTVREATYRGHRIVIRTSYQIEVDGLPIQGHLGVSNDGQVHYHAVPNLGFASAVDLVKQLIDAFPDDFQAGEQEAEARRHPHGEHGR